MTDFGRDFRGDFTEILNGVIIVKSYERKNIIFLPIFKK